MALMAAQPLCRSSHHSATTLLQTTCYHCSVDRINAQGGRMSKEDTKHVSRREFLRLAGIGVGAGVLAACAGQAPAAPTAAPGAAPTAAPAAAAPTAAPAAVAATAAPAAAAEA